MNLFDRSRDVLAKQIEEAYLLGVRQKPLDYREKADQVLTAWLTLATSEIRKEMS